MEIQLRDYQIDIANKAFEILKRVGIVYLVMSVRTGKTLTSLNIANLYGAKKVLFITKLKAISSTTLLSVRRKTTQSTTRTSGKSNIPPRTQVYLSSNPCTYHSISLPGSSWMQTVSARRWAMRQSTTW